MIDFFGFGGKIFFGHFANLNRGKREKRRRKHVGTCSTCKQKRFINTIHKYTYYTTPAATAHGEFNRFRTLSPTSILNSCLDMYSVIFSISSLFATLLFVLL